MNFKDKLRQQMAWKMRTNRNIVAADMDKRMRIPPCARRQMQHKPYTSIVGGGRDE